MLLKKSLIIFLLLLVSFFPNSAVLAQPVALEIPQNTLAYLHAQQQPDGGMPGLSGTSDPGTTARALLALKAHGIDPQTFTTAEGKTMLDYLSATYEGYIVDDGGLLFPGNAGLMLAALASFNMAPAGLADTILIAQQSDGSFSTAASKDYSSGAYTDLSQALVLLGLSAAEIPVPSAAVEYLIGRQLADGTWDNGFGPDPDTTALVVVSLLSSGQVSASHASIQKALETFRSTQLDNGGWRPSWDTDELNVDTTAWISLALITASQDLSAWTKNGFSPQDALLSQLKEDGSIGGTYVNVYSTLEALLGLAPGPIFQLSEVNAEVTASPSVENQAGLVVTFADGSSLLRCVTFTGESTSGYDLISASDLKLGTAIDPAMGPGICSIEEQGCPSSNCFCKMPEYWSYWHLQDGAWAYSAVGAGSYEVKAGQVDGWGWGDSQLPANISFDQICAPGAEVFLPAVSAAEAAVSETAPAESPLSPTATSAPLQAPQANTVPYLILAAVLLILLVTLIFVVRGRQTKK
jgi:hypothetical protein